MDGTHARQQDQAEAGRAAPARAEAARAEPTSNDWRRPEASLSPASMLALQGLAGNSAVSQMVAHSASRIQRTPLAPPKPALLPHLPQMAAAKLPSIPPPPPILATAPSASETASAPAPELTASSEAPPASVVADLPPPPAADGSAPPPPDYDPVQARAVVQQHVSQLQAALQTHTGSIKQKAAEAGQQVVENAAAQRAAITATIASQKADVAAGYAAKRQHLKATVEGERQQMEAAGEQEHQQVETATTGRLESFTAETETHRAQMHEKLEQERARPSAVAHADAARAEEEVGDGAREAREIGRREAATYGNDDAGRAQAAAAMKVANETASDIGGKGPSIGKELRGGAPSVDQKHAEYAATVDKQVVEAVPKVSEAIHAESHAAAGEIHAITAGSAQQIGVLEEHTSAALSQAEAAAVGMIESGGRKQAQQLTQAAQQVAHAINKSGQEQSQQLEARHAQISQQLLAADAPDPSAVEQIVAAEQANTATAAGEIQAQMEGAHGHAIKGFEDLKAHAAQALGAMAASAHQTAEHGLQPALHEVKQVSEKRKSSSGSVTTALQQHHQTIVAGSLDQIRAATSQAVASPTTVNDKFAGDSARAKEESVGKAKEPLAQLGGNVKAAAAKAKEEHERSLLAQIGMGILKALVGILIGLVIVIALALVVAFVVGFFGVALTAFGAMMIAGAILLAAGAIYAFYQRSTNPETANMNIGARLLLSLSDATGVTALYEGITNKAMGTWKPMNLDAEARSEKITTGLVSIVMLALAAKGGGSSPYLRPVELPAAGIKGGTTAAGAVGAELWAGGKLAGEGLMDWVKAKFGPDKSATPASASSTGGPALTGPAPTRLPDLVDVLTDVARGRGDAVGADKIGFIERDPSANMTDALKIDFFQRVHARLQADPKLTVWDAMKEVIRADPKAFLFKGEDIPPEVIEQHGGLTRSVDLETVYNNMLSPKYLDDLASIHNIHDFPSFVKAVRRNRSLFDPIRDCDPNAYISREGQAGWWIPRSKSGQYSLAELVVDLALQRVRYQSGTVRFTLDAVMAKMIGFKRPTPFDGIHFGEWGEAPPGSIFGVTEGGVPEAVAPAIPVRGTTGGVTILPGGDYVTPGVAAGTVPSDVKPTEQAQPAGVGSSR